MFSAFLSSVIPIFSDWSIADWALIVLVFVWSGFVRAGLGFGGAALTLPVLLILRPDPVFWLPMIAWHLLFFTTITLFSRMGNVDWRSLFRGIKIMIVPKLIGVLGLISLPSTFLSLLVYGITLLYGLVYLFDYSSKSGRAQAFGWRDTGMLVLGGYVSGTSLVGAPLIAAVYTSWVKKARLRDTLYVLWIIMVVIKMSTFVAFEVPLQWQYSMILLPAVALGHWLGTRAHDALVSNEGGAFHRWIGAGLTVVCLLGIARVMMRAI